VFSVRRMNAAPSWVDRSAKQARSALGGPLPPSSPQEHPGHEQHCGGGAFGEHDHFSLPCFALATIINPAGARCDAVHTRYLIFRVQRFHIPGTIPRRGEPRHRYDRLPAVGRGRETAATWHSHGGLPSHRASVGETGACRTRAVCNARAPFAGRARGQLEDHVAAFGGMPPRPVRARQCRLRYLVHAGDLTFFSLIFHRNNFVNRTK